MNEILTNEQALDILRHIKLADDSPVSHRDIARVQAWMERQQGKVDHLSRKVDELWQPT